MILAGIQPSTVWFRVLQGMAAPACDQLCGGSLGPCAPQLPGVWVLQAGTGLLGKDAEARGLFGKAQQGSVTSGPVFYWSGSSLGKPVHWPAIAKLPNSTVGLAVSCNGPFWGDLQLQHHSRDASAFQSSSGGREQPGEGILLSQ